VVPHSDIFHCLLSLQCARVRPCICAVHTYSTACRCFNARAYVHDDKSRNPSLQCVRVRPGRIGVDSRHKHHLCARFTQVHRLRSLQLVRIRPGRTRVDVPHYSHVCVRCTLMATYANGWGRFNVCASVQDRKEWIVRDKHHVCVHIPLVVVASMRAHPSRTDISRYSAQATYICVVHNIPLRVASMHARVCPYGQRVLCTLTVTHSTGCGHFNARTSVQDGHEWKFRICITYVCSPHIFH
jgi:hypothetical protein